MDPELWELLETGGSDDEVAAILRLGQAGAAPEGVRVVAQFGDIATVRTPRGMIPEIREAAECASMKTGGPPLGPDIELADDEAAEMTPESPHDERRPEDFGPTGRGVIVGVVDWGFDFAHPDFRNRDGSTRIVALWDQRGKPQPDSPQPYGYGRVHERAEIDRALAADDPYAALGYHPADADVGCGSHGTHVASIAAGNGGGGGPVGIAPEADLVFVHMATWSGKHAAKLGDSVTLLEAIDFISRTASDRPWVINLSMGRHGEQHDGTTLVEQGLDAALRAAPGRAICQSAGNYFQRQIHASGQLRPGEKRTLAWEVAEADVTPNKLEIWYSWRDTLDVEVRSPDGAISARAGLGERAALRDGEREVGTLYQRAREPNTLDNHVAIFLYKDAPAGAWEVALTGVDVIDGRFHAWIERDAACPSCQSRFGAPDADPASTTGTICNGARTIAVGAYNAHEPGEPLGPFSSAGPTRDGRVKPDLCAPGVSILAARSSPREAAAGHPLLTRMSGTSMAAPHVTGTVALMFEAAPRPLRIEETHNLLLGSTRKVSPEHAGRAGSGYLDIEAAVECAREIGGGAAAKPTLNEEESAMQYDEPASDENARFCPECGTRLAVLPHQDEASESWDAEGGTGAAIPRAKVSDALGNRILDLLWEEIAEDDAPRIANRLRRLEALLDAVPNSGVCGLLARLEPNGDLYRDFEYRLWTPTRQHLRARLRQRCQTTPPPPPPPPPVPPIPVPPVPPIPPVPPVPPPPPPAPTQQTRKWQEVGQYVLESKRERRIKKFKYWGLFVCGIL